MIKEKIDRVISSISNIVTFILWLFFKQYNAYSGKTKSYIDSWLGPRQVEFDSYEQLSLIELCNHQVKPSQADFCVLLLSVAAICALLSFYLIITEKNDKLGKLLGLVVPTTNLFFNFCILTKLITRDVFEDYGFGFRPEAYIVMVVGIVGGILPFLLLNEKKLPNSEETEKVACKGE